MGHSESHTVVWHGGTPKMRWMCDTFLISWELLRRNTHTISVVSNWLGGPVEDTVKQSSLEGCHPWGQKDLPSIS